MVLWLGYRELSSTEPVMSYNDEIQWKFQKIQEQHNTLYTD